MYWRPLVSKFTVHGVLPSKTFFIPVPVDPKAQSSFAMQHFLNIPV